MPTSPLATPRHAPSAAGDAFAHAREAPIVASTGATSELDAAPPARDDRSWAAIARGWTHILASQALVALVGLASLPVLVRNLGAASYGAFSLFLTLLGCIAYQDFLRPLSIREHACERTDDERRELDALGRVMPWALAPLALGVAWPFVGGWAALALAAAVALHTAASPAYARLALAGRAALAASIRNVAWSAATACTAAASFATSSSVAWIAPFTAANAAIWIAYARCAGPRAGDGAPRSISADLRGARAAFRRHRRDIGDLFGFNVAAAIAASADRVLLSLFVPAAAFGGYAAAVELAMKLDLAGSALASLLQPAMTRRLCDEPFEPVARGFVRASTWILAALGTVVLAGALASREIVALVLGAELAATRLVFALALVGVFVHMLGFLLTPWQRARGDFATPRRAYWASACAAVVVGLVAIPVLGVTGGLLALLASRVGEPLLLAGELRTLPPSILPRRKVAVLVAIVAALAVAAFARGG